MSRWEQDPAFGDFRALADKLEAAIKASSSLLLKVAGLTPEQMLPAFVEVQGRILQFDPHGMRRFNVALEEKRVLTLAQNSIFMTCILTAAVALSEFKQQPQAASRGLLARGLNKLRQHSTNSVSLAALAWTSFYTVLGQGAVHQLQQRRGKPKTLDAGRG